MKIIQLWKMICKEARLDNIESTHSKVVTNTVILDEIGHNPYELTVLSGSRF